MVRTEFEGCRASDKKRLLKVITVKSMMEKGSVSNAVLSQYIQQQKY